MIKSVKAKILEDIFFSNDPSMEVQQENTNFENQFLATYWENIQIDDNHSLS